MPNNKNHLVKISSLTVLLTTSCGDIFFEDVETKAFEQGLVFDQLNTYQSRTLLKQAPTLPNKEQRIAIQSALLLTGSALVSYDQKYDVLDNCNLINDEGEAGSSQLVSPTRLVTAHHVIANAADSYFTVRFDHITSGYWVSDPFWGSQEENPLLANRLWQIGLDNWAIDSSVHRNSTRDKIRSWRAVLDLEGVDGGTSISSQPFTSNSSSRLDIAFLKVYMPDQPTFVSTGPPESTAFFLTSGSFSLTQPGLFFNQIEADTVERKVGNTTVGKMINTPKITPLQLLNVPPWVSTNFTPLSATSPKVPVACTYGTTDTSNAASSNNCTQISFCTGLMSSLSNSNYTNCIRTTLDAVRGSSGGAMIMGISGQYDSGVYYKSENQRLSYGVVNGITLTEPKVEAIKTWWDNNSTINSNNGFPTEDNFTSITLGDTNYKRWAKRNITYVPGNAPDLFEPIPKQPSSDGSPQCEMIPNLGCVFSSVQSNSVWGTPEQDAPVAAFPSSENDTEPGNSGTGASGQPVRPDKKTIRLQCNYNLYYGDKFSKNNLRTKAGVAIGFIGTSNNQYPTETTAVSDLGVICAPWSSASWTDNWYWILKNMRNTWDQNSARHQTIWEPVLRIALPFMTEWRKERASANSYIRPMSMKTCPPNYLLHGIGLYHSSKNLIGISKLICINNNMNILSTPLRPLYQAGIDWTYLFEGNQFSMDQRIGNPVSTVGDYKEFTCPREKIVAGIQITESADGHVKDFYLECMSAPGTL